jgi:hypothetical protein
MREQLFTASGEEKGNGQEIRKGIGRWRLPVFYHWADRDRPKSERREAVYVRISGEGVEQRFRVLQILRLKALGKPVVDFG